MTDHKVIRKWLGLKDLSFTGCEFPFSDEELRLWVKPHKKGFVSSRR